MRVGGQSIVNLFCPAHLPRDIGLVEGLMGYIWDWFVAGEQLLRGERGSYFYFGVLAMDWYKYDAQGS